MSAEGLLAGKVAVITGAASPRGIGIATARMFAKHGARIAIFDIDEQAAQTAAASIGPEHRGYLCNVTDKAQCDAAVNHVVADMGRLDILINNAGITQPVKTLEIDPKSWDRIMDVNLRGVLYMSQAVIPQMKKQKSGSIACMSSVSAQRGGGILGGPHYSAAKAGVRVKDIVLAVNGQPITGDTSLVAIIRDSAPGEKITITVERGGKKQDLIATLVARPKD